MVSPFVLCWCFCVFFLAEGEDTGAFTTMQSEKHCFFLDLHCLMGVVWIPAVYYGPQQGATLTFTYPGFSGIVDVPEWKGPFPTPDAYGIEARKVFTSILTMKHLELCIVFFL